MGLRKGGGSILYLDAADGPLKQMLHVHKPEAFELWLWAEMGEEERARKLARADYLLVATRRVDRDIIARAQRAKLVQKTGVGTDNIDVGVAASRGLPVANTPGSNSVAVAELTILLILALYRKLLLLDASIRRGEWPMWTFRSSSLEMSGKTHGLVGFGSIGREVARRSRAFGAEVVYFDRLRPDPGEEAGLGVRFLPMGELLRRSDVVSLHVPLLPGTRGLIGTEELAAMKPEAVLVNVARGGIVDESALIRALRERRIAGAALDVWEKEPVDPGNPLLRMENVVATPHVGAGTRDTLARVLGAAFGNIARVAGGKPPLHVVNGTDGETREESGKK